jgi:hypothetical protein
MSLGTEQIYGLLPAVYRTADAAQGEPLKALIGVIAEQVGVLEQDLRGLYADQFIETCAPWAVPYIGDLIGWTPLLPGPPGTAGGRAEVANTIGYRRVRGQSLGWSSSVPTSPAAQCGRSSIFASWRSIRVSVICAQRRADMPICAAGARSFDSAGRSRHKAAPSTSAASRRACARPITPTPPRWM